MIKSYIRIKSYKTIHPTIEHNKLVLGIKSPKAIKPKYYKAFGYKWYR